MKKTKFRDMKKNSKIYIIMDIIVNPYISTYILNSQSIYLNEQLFVLAAQ